MAFGNAGRLGVGQVKTAGSSWSPTTNDDWLADQLAVVVLALDNADLVDGETSLVTGVTIGSKAFTKAKEYTNAESGAATGATCSIWYAVNDTGATIPLGTTVSITLASSVTAKVITAQQFTYDTSKTIVVAGSATGESSAGGPSSLTVSGLSASDQVLGIRGIAQETNNSTILTETAGPPAWSRFIGTSQTGGGGGATNMGARAEFVATTGVTSLTSAPDNGISVDTASAMVVFKEQGASESHSGSFAESQAHSVSASGRKVGRASFAESQGQTLAVAGLKVGRASFAESQGHSVAASGTSLRRGSFAESHGHALVGAGLKIARSSAAETQGHALTVSGAQVFSDSFALSHGQSLSFSGTAASEAHSGAFDLQHGQSLVADGRKVADSGTFAETQAHDATLQGRKRAMDDFAESHGQTLSASGLRTVVSGSFAAGQGQQLDATGIKVGVDDFALSVSHDLVGDGLKIGMGDATLDVSADWASTGIKLGLGSFVETQGHSLVFSSVLQKVGQFAESVGHSLTVFTGWARRTGSFDESAGVSLVVEQGIKSATGVFAESLPHVSSFAGAAARFGQFVIAHAIDAATAGLRTLVSGAFAVEHAVASLFEGQGTDVYVPILDHGAIRADATVNEISIAISRGTEVSMQTILERAAGELARGDRETALRYRDAIDRAIARDGLPADTGGVIMARLRELRRDPLRVQRR